MQVRMFGLHERKRRRRMAHNSNSPNCFWVLEFPLFSSLSLQKPKPPSSHLFFFSPFFLSLRSFLSSPRSICSLFVSNHSLSSLYWIRPISSISTRFIGSRSNPGIFIVNFRSDSSILDLFWVRFEIW